MPHVSVPGVSGSTILLQFQSTQNATLAQSLVQSMWDALGKHKLHVENQPAGASVTGSLNEYTIGDHGGAQNGGVDQGTVPAGYKGIVDAFTNHAATITGAATTDETVVAQGGLTFFSNGGSGVFDASSSSVQGGNLFAGTGGDWTVLFDGGNNTVFGNSGNLFISDNGVAGSVGAGSNLLFVGSGSDTVVASGNDTVVAGNGNDTTFAAGPNALVFGGSGSMVFVATTGSPTFVAGGGAVTAFGGTGNGVYFEGAGAFLLDGQSGADTVTGVASITSGTSTLFADNKGNLTLFGNTTNALVAGAGNVTLNAAGSTGDNALFANSGANSLVGGAGTDFLIAGAGGGTTMMGGSGVSAFEFIKGAAGGADLIQNWTGTDQVFLVGYAGASPFTQAVGAGGDVMTLSDGTVVTFQNFFHTIGAGNIHVS
jgi:Ca2+-binding RTX toxin-like protein